MMMMMILMRASVPTTVGSLHSVRCVGVGVCDLLRCVLGTPGSVVHVFPRGIVQPAMFFSSSPTKKLEQQKVI
jgi:hypothetical protein